MGEIVNLQGKVINAVPPSGLYTATVCPRCGNPIFFHGGGRGVMVDAMAGEQPVIVPPSFYTTCLCEFEAEEMEQPRIPPKYDIVAERTSVDILFQTWHQMLDQHVELEERVKAMAGPKPVEDECTTDGSESTSMEPLPTTITGEESTT